MEPIISVVMPVYNGDKYLQEAIESILNQTEGDFEFIIINDGSTDDSPALIDKYRELDSRIKVITQENKGLISSLNTGIDEAKGKYIARMDADDVSLPERFRTQLEYMEKNSKIGACGSWAKVFDEGRNHLIKHQAGRDIQDCEVLTATMVMNGISSWAVTARNVPYESKNMCTM